MLLCSQGLRLFERYCPYPPFPRGGVLCFLAREEISARGANRATEPSCPPVGRERYGLETECETMQEFGADALRWAGGVW